MTSSWADIPDTEHIDGDDLGLNPGEDILDDLKDTITTYVAMPSDQHLDAVTLWVATTHFLPSFEYATRLVIRSAEKRSGKSRLLEIIDGTCHEALRAVNASVAAIFRSLDDEHPRTLLLDEADTVFGSKKVAEQNEDLRGLLNAGYQRGLPFLRTVGPTHEPKEFNTFAMAALAGIGKMPDTIEDRAVVVVMRRRKPGETIRPYRVRRDKPRLDEMKARLRQWALSSADQLNDVYPDMPVEDRAADTWEPLVMVADLAGGKWPALARAAAVTLTGEAEKSDSEGSPNLQLLKDIDGIFQQEATSFIPSQRLIELLHEVEDSPWKDWELTPSRLGHRLREYGIKTGHNSDRSKRGYRLEDFQDTFDRYTRPNPSEPVQGAESSGKVTDTFETPRRPDPSSGHLRTPSDSKVSTTKPRHINGKHLRTPSDALPAETGHVDADDWEDCRVCHYPKRVEDLTGGLCDKCTKQKRVSQ